MTNVSCHFKTKSIQWAKKYRDGQAGVVDAFDLSTQEAEAGKSLSSRPAWSTQQVPGHPGIHREILSQNPYHPKKKKKIQRSSYSVATKD